MDSAPVPSVQVINEERMTASAQHDGGQVMPQVGGTRGSAVGVALAGGREVDSWRRFVHGYVGFLQRSKMTVLLVWFIVATAGAIMAPFFLMNTTMNFDPPPSSPAGIADRVLAQHFPKLDKAAAGVVIVRPSHGGSVLGADGNGTALRAFSAALNSTIWSFEPGKPQICVEVDGYSSVVDTVGPAGAAMAKGLFISAHEQAAIILIQGDAKDSRRYLKFVDWVNDGLPNAAARALEVDPRLALNATQTGLGMFTEEALEGVQHDLEKMDMVAMPIALCVLSFVLRSWRLMLVPCICIGAAAATSFGVIMLPISYSTQIISFAPSVMMSCTVAMSIDYSLFLLSRYQEEVVQRGQSLEDAIESMLCSAGHTVLVSGLTLMICWLGLSFFPVNLLSSAGLSAAMAIAAAIFVNLSLTPALLFMFPNFFFQQLQNDTQKTGILAMMCCGGHLPPVGRGSNMGQMLQTPLSPTHPHSGSYQTEMKEEKHAHLLQNETERRFHRLARRVVGCKYCLIIFCVIATVPIIYVATRLEHSLKLDQLTPRGSKSTIAFDYLEETFGAGNAFPYSLVIEPPDGDKRGIMSEEFFVETNSVLQKIVDGFNRPEGTIVGVNWPTVQAAGIMILPAMSKLPPIPPNSCSTRVLGRNPCGGLAAQKNRTLCAAARCCFNNTPAVDVHCFHQESPPPPTPAKGSTGALMWGLVETWTHCRQHPRSLGCSEVEKSLGPLLDYFFERFVATDKRATYVNLQLSLDPFSDAGQAWVEYVRRELPTNGLLEPRYYLTHGAAEIKDSADTVYADFPIIGGVTLGVVFVLYWAAFGSLIIPLRAIISMCFALCWVYGLSILIYEDGVLEWTGFAPLSPTAGSPQLCWLIPVMAFSIMVGLSLDYDVFLVSRIVEYRAEGKDDVDAVLLGLAKTGRIIAAAGLIMAIAFFGLLLSDQASMNQLSFFLVTAVMFDTFIVAIFLIPAMMGLLGTANWWPKAMPTVVANTASPAPMVDGDTSVEVAPSQLRIN